MKDFMPGVKIEYHPNENCIGLHLRYKMVDNKVFVSSDLSDSIKIKALPNLPKVIFNSILDINGVKRISIQSYEITIVKACAYSWEELSSKIKLILSTYLPVEK